MFEYRIKKEGQDRLAGYAGFFIYQSMQHKTSIHAKQDILFIEKKSRGHGKEFIKYCDEMLKKIGIDEVLHSVPKSKDWSPILKRIGYKELETTYRRSLK